MISSIRMSIVSPIYKQSICSRQHRQACGIDGLSPLHYSVLTNYQSNDGLSYITRNELIMHRTTHKQTHELRSFRRAFYAHRPRQEVPLEKVVYGCDDTGHTEAVYLGCLVMTFNRKSKQENPTYDIQGPPWPAAPFSFY